MMTVHEVSKLAGVSIRTLQYYDKIGLLHPTGYTDAGYRLYDDADLERLQHILLFRELEFPLKDIKAIINSPDFDRSKALEQHAGKTSYGRKSGCVVAPIWRDNVQVVSRASWGRV